MLVEPENLLTKISRRYNEHFARVIVRSVKVWPGFDENGDLPVGVHEATIAEIIEHFGRGSRQRQLVARRLERIYNFANGTGRLARFIIFGSFVTCKGTPNDVDVFMLMDDTFDVSQVTGGAATIFHHRAAQNWLGASIFWIRRMAAVGGEGEMIDGWQIKRDGLRRGIVEVISHD